MIPRSAFAVRRGTAPLELVMALPILVGLTALMFVLGDAMIKANETTISARTEAWSQRDQGGTSGVFLFTPSSTTGNLATGSQRKSVTAPAVLGSFGEVRSVHTVMVGAWDHRDVNLNKPPLSYDAYAKVGASGLTSRIQGASSLLSDGLRGLIRLPPRASDADISEFQASQRDIRDQTGQATAEIRRKRDSEIREEKREVEDLESRRIPRLHTDIDELKRDIDELVKDKEDEETVSNHTVRSSIERLEELEMQRGKSGFLSPQLDREREDHIQALKKIDDDLPGTIQQRAEKQLELQAAKFELESRKAALDQSEKQSEASQKWESVLFGP